MPILVKLSTTLRRHVPAYVPATGLEVAFAAPMTAGALAERLHLPLEEIKVVMVNGVQSSLGQPLADGDRVAYFPAVGGG